MTSAQIAIMRDALGVREGHEWDMFEGTSLPETVLRGFLAEAPFIRQGTRRLTAPVIPVPEALTVPAQPAMSTQHGFGLLMHEIAKTDSDLARRIVTTSAPG
jgi:pyruvate dehydrogenase E1 component